MANPLSSGKPIPVWYYGAGAGVIFIAYYFYSSSKKKKAAASSAASAAAAAPAMAAATTASQTPVVPASSYGYGVDAGSLNNIEQQLQNLNAAQATTAGSASSSGVVASPAPAPAPAPAPDYGVLQGSGYTGGGDSYEGIGNNAQMQAILASGIQRYYEPVPGYFTPVTSGYLAPTTPQFIKTS